METVSTVTRIRRRRHFGEAPRLSPIAIGCGLVVSLAIASLTLISVAVYRDITKDLPSPEVLPALLAPPSGLLLEPTRFYDRSGLHEIYTLAHPAAAGASYLPLGTDRPFHLPPAAITATLVASDPVTWANQDEAPSTIEEAYRRIAERLVRDLIFQGEADGWRRAIRQRLLVEQVEQQFGRDQLMEWYLNSADYGSLAYGVDAAALVYFDKKASELSLAEAAVLAGVAEAPALNPLDTPQETIDRGHQILKQALERGLIGTAEFREAIHQDLTFREEPEGERQPFTAFINLVRRELEGRLGRDQLLRSGLRVRTSLDYDLQLQADCAVQIQLARLDGAGEEPPSTSGEMCEAGRLIQALAPEETGRFMAPGASAVVMDPATGEILAMVGVPIPGQDPAAPPGRPPGSLLTPYVHLAAYTRGLSPASLAWDIPSSVPEPLAELGSDFWEHQGPVRLRTALANDYLAPTLDLLDLIGPEQVWSSLSQLGFDSMVLPAGLESLDLVLGGGGATLLEIVHAYSVFSNLGVLAGEEQAEGTSAESGEIRPVTILQIEDANGNLRQGSSQRASRPVISAQLAYLITHSLSDEATRWRSLGHPNLLEVGRPAAAKIGATLDGRDIWTVGYTPNLAVGVWVGETAEPGEAAAGAAVESRGPSSAAAGLYHAIMQHAGGDLPVIDWERPAGIAEVDVCDPSGLLPTQICPAIVTEVFLQGNEPTQLDTLYRKYLVNRETGRLATVFTPPELVEEQVYLDLPPDAVDWAREFGFETPPVDYDLIFAAPPTAAGVNMDSPAMFAYVRGELPLVGTAGGPGFDYYRLQYGQGLNPQSWVQVGNDISTPVGDGRLGVWDTSGLSGLYALQLLVVREDQRVDKVTVQVTVDNTPPQVQILNPPAGQVYSFPEDRSISLQIQVSDDLALERVEYYLDGRLLASLFEPPYTLSVPLNPGEHILRAVAYDRAGNRAEDQVSFRAE